MSKPVRVTVPVDPEVLERFKRLAAVSGNSVGKSMGDWLSDTSDGVVAMAELMERAREQPKLVARELHGYALGLTDLTSDLLEQFRARNSAHTPPVGNTGGKVTAKPRKAAGGPK